MSETTKVTRALAWFVALALVGLAHSRPAQAQQPAGCSSPNPSSSEVIECLNFLGFQSSCAFATADFIANRGSGLGEFGGCADRGDCFPLAVAAVGGVCLGGGSGTGVAGLGSTGDIAQEEAASVFGEQILVPAVPDSVASASSGGTAGGAGTAGGVGTSTGAGERQQQAMGSVDGVVTVDFWSTGPQDGQSYQIALGYAHTGASRGTFFVDGAYTRIEADNPTTENTARGKLGFRQDFGDVFVLGGYGTVNWVDVDPDAVFFYGGGILSGFHFDLGPVKLSLGVVGQGLLSNLDREDDNTDYTLSAAYGGGVGVPLFQYLAANLQVFRTTGFRPDEQGSPEDVGSFTTLLGSLDFALSPSFLINLGYRTRFEIENYDSNAVLLGVRSFFF